MANTMAVIDQGPISRLCPFYGDQKEYATQKVLKVKELRKSKGEGQDKIWNGQSPKSTKSIFNN